MSLNRLPMGPRRYAELDKSTSLSSLDTRASPNKSAFSASPPVGNCLPEQDQVVAPNPFMFNAQPAPFSHSLNHLGSGNPVGSVNNLGSPNPSQFSYLTPNRRRSSKAKGVDIDKLPRPEVNVEASYTPIRYVTSQLNNPPTSYTNYITVDNGNAGPRYVRSSFYKIPTDESLTSSTHIPLGLVIQPLADPMAGEDSVHIVNSGETGPLRCQGCRAYVNPNWIFIQGGRTAICNLCKLQNPVPKELVCPLDANGLRTDRMDRPELSKGIYEFVAPTSYNVRKAVTPNIVFGIEASTAAYMTGIFHQVMSSIQSLLDYIPCPELTNICFVTYDTGINFFRVPQDLSKEIAVIHVPEIDGACLPLPKSAIFHNLKDDREKIDYTIEKIIKHYESNNRLQKGINATTFGTALVDCCDMLLQDGGRVMMFATQAPTTGVGKIKRRDDFKLMGTDKERSLYVPQVEEYGEWAKNWLAQRISLDLFCFAPEYFDLATIGQVCNMTGGNIYYYPNYNGNIDGERVHYDLSRNLTRAVGYDAVMTIRASQGLSFLDYTLPYGRRPIPELQFSTIDADTVINAYFKHEDKLKEDSVSLQIALLYTNAYGQRVIRVINFKAATSNELPVIFRSCDVEAVAQLIIKKNILNISNSSVPKIRKDLIDNLAAIFNSYRIHCAPSSPLTQMVFPDSLQVLPVFFLATMKSHILRTMGDTKPDDRYFDLHRFIKMPLNVLSNMWYIKVYPIHTIYEDNEYGPGNQTEDGIIIGGNIAATDEKLDTNGIYLLDNNDTIFVYVKRNADPMLIQELFGVESFQEMTGVTNFTDNPESFYLTRITNIVDQLRKNKNSSYQPVRVVTEKDAYEPSMLNLLVEDERLGESYNNFLCNVHKIVQGGCK